MLKVICMRNNIKEMEEEVSYNFYLEVMTPRKTNKEISNITKESNRLPVETEEKNIDLRMKI